jgi:hypothetical protein
MDVLDSTKLQNFQDCPRMFFYEYVYGWRSARPNNHLHFGKAVHLALEHIIRHGYRVEVVMEALDLFNDEYRAMFPESTDPIFSPKTPGRFFDLLILYLRKYADDLDKYEVYKTEFGGTVHLSPTHVLAFKMDTILQDRETGLYCSLEHKTKGGNYIPDSYRYEHEMGIQCGTYTHVLNSLFPPAEVSGVIINCLCFKKTKQPDYILERFPIQLSNSQMYVWLENTKNWMDKIHTEFKRLAESSPSDPIMKCFPLNGRNCTNWGRSCFYIDLCKSWQNPIQHQDRMPVDMQVEFWNPLEEDLREVLTL